jgi:SNF2 family DNA or RNA helicase
MLTTYHVVRNDYQKLSDSDQITFSCMVIDEAQCIKNHKTLITKGVKEVGNVIGHTRIALSGTPIENKVDELHSIFDFVNYGYLGDYNTFSRDFSHPIEQRRNPQEHDEKVRLLKRLIHPFQMRRLKTDPNILPDLPRKIDYLVTVTLTPDQERLYKVVQDDWKATMEASRERSDNHRFQRRGHIFAMLESTRRVCSHPLCLDKTKYPLACRNLSVAKTPTASGKTARLMELLDEIVPTGEKVVVFVTRYAILKLLLELVTSKYKSTGMEPLEFSGSLSLQERSNVEQRFGQESQCQVLLITVQCGGIGLNLTAASHVVHFDRCYNPAKEAQATDRCHRLGQTRPVCVHRIVTEGTYEERLEEIMRRKQSLSDLTVTRAEDWIADYDDDALFDLFMLRSGGRSSGASGSRADSSPALPLPAPDEISTPVRSHLASSSSLQESPSPLPLPAGIKQPATGPQGRKAKKARVSPPLHAGDPTDECSICLDAPGVVQLLPCGHRSLCAECAPRVQSCPLCRALIKDRVFP